MKYIRTKDKIYELSKIVISIPPMNTKREEIKSAATIEELCDELVLKDLDTGMCFVMSAVHIQDIKDNWKNLMDNNYLKNHTIYGAIWTDKGLIYKAEVKGVLPNGEIDWKLL